MSLSTFIKAVRSAKTLADERTIIQKESAAIRTSFREDYADHEMRKTNVAKLLCLFTMGERTHFGQVECLRLLATTSFSDKRLGYLGTMLLLDENQEVLTLVTNSLSRDLASPNQYIVALALTTLGNIASTEMARDLFADMEKYLNGSNNYLRKKAALCAMRLIRKAPDLADTFVPRAQLLLEETNHGVLLTGVALAVDMCVHNPLLVAQFINSVPALVRMLKSLSSNVGYSPEHDVGGVSDPFLQVKVLRLLRVLGAGNAAASAQMADILAQLASNTESTKNVGHAVLYETVETIFGIAADPPLRVLGVNILGKFLSTRDNNTRYVALNALLKVAEHEPTAVQRHRATVLECLHDHDVSIRRRALELAYSLVNHNNVRVMVRELLAFLEIADHEFKANLVTEIAQAANNFAPNRRWHLDTILRALRLAGNDAKDHVLSSFIALVAASPPDLQLYATQKLYTALRRDLTQEGLVLVGVWIIAEYAETLLAAGPYEDEQTLEQVGETELVNLFESVLSSAVGASDTVQEYAVTALIKLSVRVSQPAHIEHIRRLLLRYVRAINVEVQQRVAEYCELLAHDSVRRGVLEKMPVPEFKRDLSKKTNHRVPPKASTQPQPETVDLLLDLVNDVDPSKAAPSAPVDPSKVAPSVPVNLSEAAPSVPVDSPATDILNLFDSPAPAPITAFSRDPVALTFTHLPKEKPGQASITAHVVNSSSTLAIADLSLQFAVPKSQRLQFNAPSSSSVAPGHSASLNLHIHGPDGSPLRLRVRLSYALGDARVFEQLDFKGFPGSL